tara:strand:- start:108 stop:785 length:678 start_codon:yes stop_codon:yes gene_type:complete
MSTFRHKPTGKKFFFAHIPRTAGRFIETNLMVKNEFEWCDDWTKFGIQRMYESYKGIEFGHFHREYYKKYLNVEGIPQISIIRNPLKRFISASIYINRVYGRDTNGQYSEESLQECQSLMEDENYFYTMLQNFPMMMPESSNWYRSQMDFLTEETQIWRFEDGFKDEFVSWLGGTIGVDLEFQEDLPYLTAPDEGVKLKPTPKLLNNLRNLYRKEIELYYPELAA